LVGIAGTALGTEGIMVMDTTTGAVTITTIITIPMPAEEGVLPTTAQEMEMDTETEEAMLITVEVTEEIL